jgi:hypothetical protein
MLFDDRIRFWALSSRKSKFLIFVQTKTQKNFDGCPVTPISIDPDCSDGQMVTGFWTVDSD